MTPSPARPTAHHLPSSLFPLQSAITLLLAATLAVHAGTWPTFHGPYDLTGYAPDALPAQPVRLWKTHVGKGVDTTPVSDGTRIYALSGDATVTALSMDGAVLWSTPIAGTPGPDGATRPEDIAAPMLLAGDTLVVGAESGIVYALATANGKRRWTYDIGGTIKASANLVRVDAAPRDRIVVMEQESGTLHAIDPATGAKIWVADPAARCDGSPAAADGNIVFGSCAAAFHVFSGATGKETASVSVGEGCEMAGGLAIKDAVAYSGNRSGSLAAADLKKGDIRWTHAEGSGELFTTPAVTDELVVFMTGDSVVYAVTRAEGKAKWSFDTAGAMPTSPVISGNHVVLAVNGALHLLDLAGGERRWQFAVSDAITAPAIVNSRIVVGTDDGAVAAFGAPPPAERTTP